jgi:pre-60S factor REI1
MSHDQTIACDTTTTTMLPLSNPTLERRELEASFAQPAPPSAAQNSGLAQQSGKSLFHVTECIICDQISSDLEANLWHMSKTHGLHVDVANLVVQTTTLLARLYTIVSRHHRCLKCHKQCRSKRAAQQHMVSKEHCMFSLTSDALAGMFALDSINMTPLRPLITGQTSTERLNRDLHERSSVISASSISLIEDLDPPFATTVQAYDEQDSSAQRSSLSGTLSARSLKQTQKLDKQHSRLRVADQHMLSHLPAAQQRALLLTQLGQLGRMQQDARKQHAHLGTAGNTFGCLRKTWLVRQPPHFGNVRSLKH